MPFQVHFHAFLIFNSLLDDSIITIVLCTVNFGVFLVRKEVLASLTLIVYHLVVSPIDYP